MYIYRKRAICAKKVVIFYGYPMDMLWVSCGKICCVEAKLKCQGWCMVYGVWCRVYSAPFNSLKTMQIA